MTLRKFCVIMVLVSIGSYTGFLINPVWTPIAMLISFILSFIIILIIS